MESRAEYKTKVIEVGENHTLLEWKDIVKGKSIDVLQRMLKRNEQEQYYELCSIIKNELERRKIAEQF